MRTRFGITLVCGMAMTWGACTPGYLTPKDLQAKQQGPSHCATRCAELGMRMGALVLVADALPGCVCLPKRDPKAAPAPEGASAATTGYVVLAAAAAAQQQQQQQQQQRQSAK